MINLIHFSCSQGDQTAAHVFAECTDAESRAMQTMGFVTKGDVVKGLSDFKKAPEMARALINSSWLPQLSVFNKLRQEDTTATEEESAWAQHLPPGQARRQGCRWNPSL